MTRELDLLVVGSGVAGLSAVVRAASHEPGTRVGVVSKGRISESATQWAQGGVAAVLHHDEADRPKGADSPRLHAADTIRAGAGLCDDAAVEVLVSEGPARVRELAALGAVFDTGDSGRWNLAREGGHSTARVVHAGGAATGAEVERALVEAARSTAAEVYEGLFVTDLVIEGGRCRGVRTLDRSGRPGVVRAGHTLLATGGAGQLYAVTTNPSQATGDGLAMALRARVAVADVEFIQFHPTALYVPVGAGPRPLLSEALRGEGALLRDSRGRRFVDEMQPRDVVAAAVAESIREGDLPHVWLDVNTVDDFESRFPSLAASARSAGLDPGRDWLPVAPAAHYICGGIVTDLDGATTLPGLSAAGEVACTGVHGANRLASNSLLEGMVFAARAVDAVLRGKDHPEPTGALMALLDPGRRDGSRVGVETLARPGPAVHRGPAEPIADIQRIMTEGAGVVRDAASLEAARKEIDAMAAEGVGDGESANLVELARAVLSSAAERRESRGGHRRADHPSTRPALSHRFVQW